MQRPLPGKEGHVKAHTVQVCYCCNGIPKLKLWCICEYSRTPNRARRCIWFAGISSSTMPCKLDVFGLPPARDPCCCASSFDSGPFGNSKSRQPCTAPSTHIPDRIHGQTSITFSTAILSFLRFVGSGYTHRWGAHHTQPHLASSHVHATGPV